MDYQREQEKADSFLHDTTNHITHFVTFLEPLMLKYLRNFLQKHNWRQRKMGKGNIKLEEVDTL